MKVIRDAERILSKCPACNSDTLAPSLEMGILGKERNARNQEKNKESKLYQPQGDSGFQGCSISSVSIFQNFPRNLQLVNISI